MKNVFYENTKYSKIFYTLIIASFAYLLFGVALVYPKENIAALTIGGTLFSILYWVVCVMLIRKSKGTVEHKDKLLALAALCQVLFVVAMVILG